MNISYATNKLEKILCNPRLLKQNFSSDYKKIKNRMSELIAANSLADIPPTPPPRRHKLSGEFQNCWGIDYSKNDRIIIEPVESFDINDLSTITSIKIIMLGDYH